MDELYQLTATRNAELRCRWQRVCLCHRAAFIVPEVVDFVATVGRMKFVRPLYRELFLHIFFLTILIGAVGR